MGNDNKTVRSKTLDWQFFVKTYGLFHITLVAPCWLSAQAVQECVENQLIDDLPYLVEIGFHITGNGFADI